MNKYMNVNDEVVARLIDAIEGELEGLVISQDKAKAILKYVLEGVTEPQWIPWNPDPVLMFRIPDSEQAVTVKLRCGEIGANRAGYLSWKWTEDNPDDDIVAYKLGV